MTTVVVTAAGESITITYSTAPKVVSFRDFTTASAGMLIVNGLIGAGETYEMVPNSSTKASQVPTTVGTTTNPFTLMVAGGNTSSNTIANLILSNFYLHGTPQGMLYNGLRVGYSTNAVVSDVRVKGIPGNSGANPGETFSVNLWHANGVTLNRVIIDGTDDTGAKVAASAFGFNNLTGATTNDCRANGTQYGSGATHYKCGDITHNNLDVSGNHRPLNFERCFGSINLNNVNMKASVNRPHVTVNTDSGSAKVTIVDPVVDAWPLRVGVKLKTDTVDGLYMGNPQTQLVSDVKLIVAGVDRTADPKYLLCGNYW